MENQRVTKIRSPVEPDSVDVSLDVWSRELPDLDLGIEGIVERIDKLKHYVDRAMQETLEAYDLSHGEWKLLANLRWGGPPYRGKPGKLAKRLGLSSGAMTNRLDNMERRGVIRGITEEGRRLWDETVGAQAEKEAVVGYALTLEEREQLNELLRRLMRVFEAEHGPIRKVE